jgi:hypothetical protein
LAIDFPLETIEKLAKALRISTYRLFLDVETVDEMPQTALIEQYNELLQRLQREQLSEAKLLFLEKGKRSRQCDYDTSITRSVLKSVIYLCERRDFSTEPKGIVAA